MYDEINILKKNSYFTGKDVIRYKSAISQIKKGSSYLRPIFEAFMNAWESFNDSFDKSSYIKIIFDVFNEELNMNVEPKYRFNKITIEDNGIGFNNKNFERFKCLNDDTKGYNNKGTGRIQYIKFFDNTDFISVFNNNKEYYERHFLLSASDKYLQNNSILFYNETKKTETKITGTKVIFKKPLNEKDESAYLKMSMQELKQELLKNFVVLLCNAKEKMPKIKLEYVINNIVSNNEVIEPSDIPTKNEDFEIKIPFKQKTGNSIVETGEKGSIIVKSFKIDSEQLEKNQIAFAVKGETINSEINLQCLSDKDSINGNRYLFLLQSPFFDNKISDNRGKIDLIRENEFKKLEESFFDEPTLLLDDIENEANNQIINNFPEIQKKQNDFKNNINELKKMFLLNNDAINHLKFNITDDDKTILTKVYRYDSETLAKRDAILKKQLDNLVKLDTSDDDYEVKLSEQVNELVKQIPLQNRTSLTQYVARRQLILKQFELILNRDLQCQKEFGVKDKDSEIKRNKDESLLHNLIFHQHSTETNNSSLWLLNEEFIYFDGVSEKRLCDIKLNGEKVFKQSITEQEENYLKEFGEQRDHIRPDVLLFPGEGKAVIIEFKAPSVNPSKYITQIQNYASLLLNFSEGKFKLHTFYGYLIGENIEAKDVMHNNPYFLDAPNFDYLYEPAQPVINDNGGDKGSLYMEVLKYSTLLKRAKLRNKIYKEKLGLDSIEEQEEQ